MSFKRDESEFSLLDEDLQKLQKKEAILTDDDVDIDKEVQAPKPKPPNVKQENIPKVEPPKKTEDDFYTDIDKKYLIPEDDIEEEEEPEIPDEPEEYDEPEFATRVSDGKPRTNEGREFLNRQETIFSEPKDLVKYEKPKSSIVVRKEVKRKPPPQEETVGDKVYSGVVTIFAIIFFVALVVFFFGLFIYITKDKIELSEYEKQEAIEMSTFLSYNEPFILGVNELSDQKKTSIESYIKGTTTKDELTLQLMAIAEKEGQIIELFNEYKWTFDAVVTLDNMTLEFLNANRDTTLDLLMSLRSSSQRGDIIQIYNSGATQHSAQLYAINQYAKQEVDKLGVDTYIEGTAIQIDLSNVR